MSVVCEMIACQSQTTVHLWQAAILVGDVVRSSFKCHHFSCKQRFPIMSDKIGFIMKTLKQSPFTLLSKWGQPFPILITNIIIVWWSIILIFRSTKGILRCPRALRTYNITCGSEYVFVTPLNRNNHGNMCEETLTVLNLKRKFVL